MRPYLRGIGDGGGGSFHFDLPGEGIEGWGGLTISSDGLVGGISSEDFI